MMSEIWVYAEQNEGKLKKVTFELLGMARQLAETTGVQVGAVLCGDNVSELIPILGEYGADVVYIAQDEQLKTYNSAAYAHVVADAVRAYNPAVFFIGHTATGRDLAPRVAQRLGAGLVSDCTGLEGTSTDILFTRPIYAGKALAKVKVTDAPVMATIRPNVLPLPSIQAGKMPRTINLAVDIGTGDLQVVIKELIKHASTRPELTEADIIVSGGRGMKGPENFAILEELADVLGAAVGASRAAVDAGWRDQQFQVGQTGKTVTPTLYIACGISGAIQHLAGMSSSKYIVAINKDPEANIFKVADYGIVGDLFQVVPALIAEFKKLKDAS